MAHWQNFAWPISEIAKENPMLLENFNSELNLFVLLPQDGLISHAAT